MDNLQSQETSNPCSISQYAALAAIEGDQASVAEMREEFARRRGFVLGRLRAMPGLSVIEPQGAFYAFIKVSAHFGRQLGGRSVSDSATFCGAALDVAHVALVPGSAFGAEGYVRMSFACDMEQLRGGLDQIVRLIQYAT